MVVGRGGVIGQPAARPAAKAPSPVPVPVPIPFPSMAVWTAAETIPKSGTVLSVTVPYIANGCPSLIGLTAVKVVTRELAGERESSSQQNMVATIAKETPRRLRSAIHRLVQVSD